VAWTRAQEAGAVFEGARENSGFGAGAGAASGSLAAWSKACAALRCELGEDTFGSWIAPARLRAGARGEMVIVTPTGLARDWIKRNAWRRIDELWSQHDPEHRRLDLKSRTEFEQEVGETAPRPEAAPPKLALVPAVEAPPPARPAGLQERMTFDSFVTGPSNEFAVSVARRVARGADGGFNPVLIHGPYGFGKTHLLNAIGWEALRLKPDAKVVYLTAEQFTSTFVRAVLDKTGPAFKVDLRAADLLLIDDVHFIGGKKSSQEELFHTLAALIGEGRRVVFTADRPPSALNEVEARLRSHLGSGLVCGIEPADRAMRMGVLERKLGLLSRQLGVSGAARPEVLEMLADRFPESVRELEGGLNTLAFRAGERLSTMTVDDAEAILRPHLAKGGGERRVTVDEIQKATAEHFALKQADLLCERRTRAIARPRQVAMYLAKTLTTRSYPDIGRRFGGRDHTTVLHAVRRIEALKGEDPAIAADIEAITRKLRG
jgi:chromosomal replication initiator protein